MAKLYFRYGAMGSSKTANALMTHFNYLERGKKAILIKPRIENRDGIRTISSRIGLSEECLFINELTQELLEKTDAIIVDEAQFLTKDEINQLTDIVDELEIPVLCYGLRSDFLGNFFEGSHRLMEIADSIEEIKTVCFCGKKAIMNARIDQYGKVLKAGNQVMLGSNESYISLCRKHWKLGVTSKE